MKHTGHIISIWMLLTCFQGMCADSSLIREDREWVYLGEPGNCGAVAFGYRMYFDGTRTVDGKEYNILHTTDGIAYWHDGFDTEVRTTEIEAVGVFLLREESGRVYLHSPLEGDGNFWSLTEMEPGEYLLYDFNAKEGESMSVINGCGELQTGKVTSTFTIDIGGEECRCYTIRFDVPDSEITVMEGLGNITMGCLPFFIGDIAAGGLPQYIPSEYHVQQLSKVLDKDGNTIYDNQKWNSGAVKNIYGDRYIEYAGEILRVERGRIAVYDMAGKLVAAGADEVSTAALQPGVYIVRAGSMTRKIAVR